MADRQEKVFNDWKEFFEQCMSKGLDYNGFHDVTRKQASKSPLHGLGVLQAWAAGHQRGFVVQPRQMNYFEQMLQMRIFSDVDALRFILNRLKTTLSQQNEYLIKSGSCKGEWRQTIEASMLSRLCFQMVHYRGLIVHTRDRTPDVRMCRPLVTLMAAFLGILGNISPLIGPASEIGHELGKYIGAYINDLAKIGLLTSQNNRPIKCTYIRTCDEI